MKNDVKSLVESFRTFKETRLKEIQGKIKYDYGDHLSGESYKHNIAEALTLWEFVRTHLKVSSPEDWKARREFLKVYMDPVEIVTLIGTIAMLESMPTSMFREILWKQNIDFMSYGSYVFDLVAFESFLRRVTLGQMVGIKDNYEDLFVKGEVPRMFSIKDRRKGVTVESLLAEESHRIDIKKRYTRKGSWSYNLLGLDFGFNQYPGGELDDERIVEVSPFNFLSRKKHADDFVVNTENGKYWKLYKLARSNYGWQPNKEVKLKTHICPGFWYTLFAHALFWILSPLAFLSLLTYSFFSGDVQGSISFWDFVSSYLWVTVSAVTPLWLLSASFRFLFRKIFNERRREAFANWFDKNSSKVLRGVVAFVFLLIFAFFGWLTFLAFQPAFGTLGTILLILLICSYLFPKFFWNFIFEGRDKTKKFSELPLILRIVLIVGASIYTIYCLGALGDAFLTSIIEIGSAILHLVSKFFYYLTFVFGYLWIGLRESAIFIWKIKYFILGLAALYFTPWLLTRNLDKPKKERNDFMDRIDRMLLKPRVYGFFSWMFVGFLLASFVLFVYALFQQGLMMELNTPVFIILAFFLLSVYGGWLFEIFHKVRPEIKEIREDFNYYIDQKGLSVKRLSRNKWFMALSLNKKRSAIAELFGFVRSQPLLREREKKEVLRILTPTFNRRILNILKSQDFLKLEYPLEVIAYISEGMSYRDAVKKVKKDKETRNSIMGFFDDIVDLVVEEWFPVLAHPFVVAGEFIWKIFVKIGIFLKKLFWEWPKTLIKLWHLFNERCPYVTKSTTVDFD